MSVDLLATPGTLVVVGGHPGDAAAACGGTLLAAKARGWRTVSLALNGGGAGIEGESADDAAAVRKAEARRAAEILGCEAVFADQTDGAADLTNARYASFAELLRGLKPTLVLTHWPVDTHRDHRAAGLLAFDLWQREGGFRLAWHEVSPGGQTQGFAPTAFVDVTAHVDRKHLACLEHASQDGPAIVREHAQITAFRGLQHGCDHAEAYAVQHGSSALLSPDAPAA